MNSRIKKALLVFLAVSAMIVAFVLLNDLQFTSNIQAPKDRITAPDWELKDMEGNTVKSSDFKGKVVILDFWTIWSAPCRAELPTFVELQKKYNKDGLVIIGISVDQGGVVDVKPFSQQEGLNYRILLADEKIATAFGGIPAIPTTFVIDEDGRIASKHVGLTPKREFDHEAKSLLGL